jgi:hypothetical protein
MICCHPTNFSSKELALSHPITFSLYQGKHTAPVMVLCTAFWVLANGIEIEASIIGQSHRIYCNRSDDCVTEYIACTPMDSDIKALDSMSLEPGTRHADSKNISGLIYEYQMEVVPILFDDMSAYCQAISAGPHVEILQRQFPHHPESADQGQNPFTGIAVDPTANQFYTVHTYPESQFSIISRTRIHCPL